MTLTRLRGANTSASPAFKKALPSKARTVSYKGRRLLRPLSSRRARDPDCSARVAATVRKAYRREGALSEQDEKPMNTRLEDARGARRLLEGAS